MQTRKGVGLIVKDNDLGCEFVVMSQDKFVLSAVLEKYLPGLPVDLGLKKPAPAEPRARKGVFTLRGFAIQEGWSGEREMLEDLIRVHQYSRAVAKLLGVSDILMLQKLKRYGIKGLDGRVVRRLRRQGVAV